MIGARHEASIVVPTFGREAVLINTLRLLLTQSVPQSELIVIDQTLHHDELTVSQLAEWRRTGVIRWIQQSPPSITAAMNRGLIEARSPLVLFLDDDIVPGEGLIEAHLRCHAEANAWAVVGQVLQPGQEPRDVEPIEPRDGLRADLEFPFYSTRRRSVNNVMAGNLSVKRDKAIAVGGFDENFVRVAYRFETDFARRLIAAGGTIVFEPEASIHHLRAERGGTRSYIDHRRSHRPDHSVGDYYFAMRHARGTERWGYSMHRLVRSVCTKYHLRRPWWIPPKLVGELRGIAMAAQLVRANPCGIQSCVDMEPKVGD